MTTPHRMEELEAIGRGRALTEAESRELARLVCAGKGLERRWTPAQDRRLMRMFGNRSVGEMAKALGRTVNAVYVRISHLRRHGHHLPNRRSWDAANAARSAAKVMRREGARV